MILKTISAVKMTVNTFKKKIDILTVTNLTCKKPCQYFSLYCPLTTLPTVSTKLNLRDIG